MNILIPCAGKGSRFADAGYTFPKPLIPVNNLNGDPMIKVVVDNLNTPDAHYIFLVQESHYKQYNLRSLFDRIAPGSDVIAINGITEGAACTTLLAKDLINSDEPLIIANSDQFVEWEPEKFWEKIKNSKPDASILTFNSSHPKWSYAQLDGHTVIRVAEKNPISTNATVGIYYWAKGSDYVKYAEQMIAKNIRTNNEFYVCPVFNEAIGDGKYINIHMIQKMWGLGTPEDLEYFIENYHGNNITSRQS